MSNKAIILFFSLLVITGILVSFQRYNVNRIGKAVENTAIIERTLRNYVLASFDSNSLRGKVEVTKMCEPYLKDGIFVLYLPSGLCRACFSSLLFAFQDHELPGDRVVVISEREDVEVKAECVARGITFMVSNQEIEFISDIILFRLYRGFLPISMNYNLGRNSILPLFFSEDEQMLQILSGAA